MKILVSFSGGKDSQACLIKAAHDYGVDKIEAVFCDTGWEHPDTYRHITDVCTQMGVKITTLKSKYDFVSLAIYKKRFPSIKARFCTEELKIKPMIDYVLSLDESCIIIQGIRSKESKERAEMDAECMYFKHYFEPIETNKTRILKYERELIKAEANNQISKIKLKIQKVKKRMAKGYTDPKYYIYRKKDVFEFCKKYDASVLRPIKEWTAQDVIDCILDAGQKPNPLYYRGFSRVGCFPCIMCRKNEAKLISQDDFGKNRLLEAEALVVRSFFPPTYIPKRFCKNGQYPMVQEVFDYVNRNDVGMNDMFEPERGYSCMSIYHGLCE